MNIMGIEIQPTFLLSLWGAVLSTLLAMLKISEYWTNRFRVEVSPIYRSCEEVGHDISIKNLSSKPALLEYMELFTKKNGEEERCLWSPEDSFLNARIEQLDSKVYNFSQSDYFNWSNKEIFVRLYFAGQKPIIKNLR